MPRISRLQRKQVAGESLAIYDRVLGDRGNVPNMFRTLAHRPQVLEPVQKLDVEPWKEYAERAWVDSVGACMGAI